MIFPREVEGALHGSEKLRYVVVLAVPDETWGESVLAFVVSKDPSLTEQDLEEYCVNHENLARYKRPRSYRFVEELPRNASGKIQKFLLREQYRELSS